jgi:hypothetical protein
MAFAWSAPPNLAAGQPPLAGHACRAGPSGCSCRALPACEHRHRPGQGADIGDRVAVGDEQVGVIPGPQSALPVPGGCTRPRPAVADASAATVLTPPSTTNATETGSRPCGLTAAMPPSVPVLRLTVKTSGVACRSFRRRL